MKRTFDTPMGKTYGIGFDAVTARADIRAFMTWWNDRSAFPVGQQAPEPLDLPAPRMAA
jgi:hypothetical protein